MNLVQLAGMLPRDPQFRTWVGGFVNGDPVTVDEAARFVRIVCKVAPRAGDQRRRRRPLSPLPASAVPRLARQTATPTESSMSDINAAPSSTEPAEIAAETTGISAGGNSGENAAISSASTEAGTATAGELGSTLEPDSSTSAMRTALQSIGALSDTPTGENSNNASGQSTGVPSSDSSASASLSSESLLPAAGSSGSGDAPAVAAPGESIPATGVLSSLLSPDRSLSEAGIVNAEPLSNSNSADALALSHVQPATSDANASAPESSQRQQVSSAADALQAGEADAGNAGVSPAAGQSASDTASCAQDASQGGDTAADALRAELGAAHVRIAALEQQLNAATAAKPHATSLLQKLEAGEAIVLGDLQSRLRAFVDAL